MRRENELLPSSQMAFLVSMLRLLTVVCVFGTSRPSAKIVHAFLLRRHTIASDVMVCILLLPCLGLPGRQTQAAE